MKVAEVAAYGLKTPTKNTKKTKEKQVEREGETPL